MTKTTLLLLAAGNSTRMGSPKQLLDYGGVPLLRHAARQALDSRCDRVIVVLGADSDAVRRALFSLPVDVVENPRWDEGMGTSIQAGLRAVKDADAAILALADQPLVTAAVYDRLIRQHELSGQPIVTSQYAGTVGVPVLFAKSLFGPLLALKPSQGCKGVILAHLDQSLRIDCPEAEADVDTPQDYEQLVSR